MKINLEKIAKVLKEYEGKNGTIAVRSHENVNTCTSCWTGSTNCTGKCLATCYYTCEGTCKGSCLSR